MLTRADYSLPLTREVHLDTQSADISAEVIRETGRSSLWKEAKFIGVCTSSGSLKFHKVFISATPELRSSYGLCMQDQTVRVP